MRRNQLSIRTRILLELHGHAFIFIHFLLNMEYNIPKTTSDSQEAKEKAEEVLKQVKAIRRQLRTKPRGNLGIKASVKEIKPLSNIENIRFRLGSGAANENSDLDKYRYSVEGERLRDLGDYYIGRMQEAMEDWYSKPRDGRHVTDVVMCPRQRVYREIDRLPIGAKTVSIYSTGKAMHEAIQLLFLSDKRTFEKEKYVEYDDIQGSVDIYDRRRNTPLEFKTTRASDIKEPKSFHVEQLKYYMAMLEASEGYVLYQLLMHFGETPFKAFRITMNAQERRDQRKKLVTEINSLKRAMESGEPSMARSVEKDPTLNWLCKDCPYLADCKGIQQAAAGAA
jgi:CRISPR/Cas system-associated exonuclease Cas4 (RecB family)